jgi:UDP-N-acetylglucosamine diphosphorylase / glucose-1-phosphate thymidylyltransferase / UDP-N-acetylgalactosamine diphosphorylase / glucosamine-1-phosphate N-acetyltransferase / galactosamine-1-phosphate N-acetyltransferase
VIEGPVLIGPNSQIGPNAYIRGATSIGSNCFVGNGAEVKNSIIYNNTYISRQCYVGDSIIGTHVTLGAGTCTENHRHDGRHHVSIDPGKTGQHRPPQTRRHPRRRRPHRRQHLASKPA